MTAATRRSLSLGDGRAIEMVLIPAGEFTMGSLMGQEDERPPVRVRIEKPFWMAARETDNHLYAAFDPKHDSGLEDKNAYQFGVRGFPANKPEQPVVRVSWEEAMAFCRWLSARTGERITLPSEAQWEYACRAGNDLPFSFGGLDADFSAFANLADTTLSGFASDPYTVDVPLKHPTCFDDWIPKDTRFNDGALLTVAPGRYRPNAWELYDMHGNAAEWTRSSYAASPAAADPSADTAFFGSPKVVRGGSWRDRPPRATSSFRLSYPPWQRVYNVTFRVVSEGPAAQAALHP
jgi:formylglycine-generating enzyme required for sulfatase activity